jgi:hypothetical protein
MTRKFAQSLIFSKQISHTIPATMVPTGTTQTVNWINGNFQILDLGARYGAIKWAA